VPCLVRWPGKIPAGTVGFIIKEAPFMTGSVLRFDGGYVLGGEEVTPMPPGIL